MPLVGFKDEHFSFFQRSYQLGLIRSVVQFEQKKLRSLICFALLFWEIRKTYIPGFESSSIQHALGTDANIQSARNLNRNLSLSFSDSMGLAFVGLTCVSEAITGKSLSEALLFAEHVLYKNCSECQKQFLYTTCSPQVWAWNFHVLILSFNELVVLWVSWCKNKIFWRRFTCTELTYLC